MSRGYSFAAASRRIAFSLAAFSLAANFALAGTTRASASGRSGGQKSKAAPARAKKVKPAAAEPTLVSENAAPQPSQRPAAANAFKTVGDPFLALATQTPTPQQQTPAQRDATRPPGTEQQQPVPPGARPRPSDPTAPPGTERQSPRTTPGTTAPEQTQERRTPQPAPTQDPSAPPVSTDPLGTPTPEVPADQQLPEPDFPTVQPRPVPPLPSLARVGVNRDDTLPLTLNEAIRRALENNNTIEVARNDVRLAESTLLGLRGVYDPSIVYRSEINNSIRPVPNIFGGAGSTGTVSTTDYNNDFSVQKQFGKGGGNYTYFFNNTRENTDATNTTLNPFYSSNQGITFTQPLWRNRSIDRNRQQIRIQQKRLQQSDADFRRSTIEVISQVQRAYWDLVFALRDEQNQIANLNLARENFRRTEASVAAGASAPLQRAEIETELSTRESSLLVANQQVTFAENTLKNLLLKDPLSPDWSKPIVPTDQPSFDETPVNLEASLKEARENRPEMRRLKLEEDVNDINLQFYKNQTKPRIDLVGTFQTNGLAGTVNPNLIDTEASPLISGDPNTSPSAFLLQEINALRAAQGLGAATVPIVPPTPVTLPQQFIGGYGQTLQNLFSFDTRQIVVSAVIQFPFKNRAAKANLAFTQIQREQLAATMRSQEQTIEVEVRNSAQAVETARRRVLAARAALRSAEEQLAGERRLYQVGRSTTFLLFQRENALVNAQNQELQAQTDYNKALADLQRATSTTLRSNNVFIDSPVAPEKFGK